MGIVRKKYARVSASTIEAGCGIVWILVNLVNIVAGGMLGLTGKVISIIALLLILVLALFQRFIMKLEANDERSLKNYDKADSCALVCIYVLLCLLIGAGLILQSKVPGNITLFSGLTILCLIMAISIVTRALAFIKFEKAEEM